ncbi:hypothetical protein EVAR_43423_1 [Eumeta japonica]|uniref:Uncharacterized protein n=1 Tax=Eumeta variegata TaxID=151549 RepID=A0A4C1WTD9_EUMVA|nr:hypothetical protein EVAR_43423_1 [Eumeta japonica]
MLRKTSRSLTDVGRTRRRLPAAEPQKAVLAHSINSRRANDQHLEFGALDSDHVADRENVITAGRFQIAFDIKVRAAVGWKLLIYIGAVFVEQD